MSRLALVSLVGYIQNSKQVASPAIRLSKCLYSSKSSKSEPAVALSNDGSMYMCWHPEEPFPYECSKPLPRKEAEMQEGESVLKVQYLLEDQYRYKEDGPTVKELEKMFFTTKHTFKPTPGKRKKLPVRKDRERFN